MTLISLYVISLVLLALQVIHVNANNPYPKRINKKPDIHHVQQPYIPDVKNPCSYSPTSFPPVTSPPKPPQPTLAPVVDCPKQSGKLMMSEMGLKRVPDGFVRDLEIVNLYLNNNEIEKVSTGAFAYLPRLSILDLSGNRIPIDQLLWFAEQKNLIVLNMDDNTGNDTNHRIDNYFEKQPRLNKLYLRGNRIVYLNVRLIDFAPTLTHLYLSRNNINTTSFLNDLPKTLRYLYLQNNSISSVAAGVLRDIYEFNIDENLIEEICNVECAGDNSLSLQGASQLQKLHVSGNKIVEVTDDAFQYTTSLTTLDLSGNQIKKIENGTLSRLSNLEHLNLGNNKLTTVPSLCDLAKLTSLDLSGNDIADIHTNSLCNLPQLETVLLNNNRIHSVHHNAFRTYNGLNNLDLSNNRLSYLPYEWIVSSSRLRVLLLKDNHIKDLGKLSLMGMDTLEKLHLENNPLGPIPVSSFDGLPKTLLLHFCAVKVNIAGVEKLDDDEEDDDDNDYDDKDDKDDENDKDDNSIGNSSW